MDQRNTKKQKKTISSAKRPEDPNQESFDFEKLTPDMQHKVLEFLRFAEVCRLRSFDKWLSTKVRQLYQSHKWNLWHDRNIDVRAYAWLVHVLRSGVNVRNINMEGPQIRGALLHASSRGDTSILELLSTSLRNGRYCDCVLISGNYISDGTIHLAASNGHLDFLRKVLALPGANAHVNRPNRSGVTPLHYAARNGHVDVVRALLDVETINLNCQDKEGLTPLHCAADEGRVEIVGMLLAVKGISPNIGTIDGSVAPLVWAVNQHYTDVVKLFLQNSDVLANINVPDSDGVAILHHAAYAGNTDVGELLLNVPGIDVNSAQDQGWTPLHWAAFGGEKEFVQLLLRYNIDVSLVDNEGRTAIDVARENRRHAAVQALSHE